MTNRQLLIRAKSALERGRDAFGKALWHTPIRDADETFAEMTSVVADLDTALAEQCTASDDTPSKSRMKRVAALEQDAARDREADRNRFSDPDFNRWLDEGISDAGHTVWDAIGDTPAAWTGWMNRQLYAQPAAQGEAVAWAVPADEEVERELFWNESEAWDYCEGRDVVPVPLHPPHPQVPEPPNKLQAEIDRLKEVLHDEIAANLAVREKGGAHDDEDMSTFLDRLIAERDELRARAQTSVTKDMVYRFLGWRLPESFGPDCYVTFDRDCAKKNNAWPVGTNILSFDEAQKMLEHVLAPIEPPSSLTGGRVTDDLAWEAECEFNNVYDGENFRQALRASIEFVANRLEVQP